MNGSTSFNGCNDDVQLRCGTQHARRGCSNSAGAGTTSGEHNGPCSHDEYSAIWNVSVDGKSGGGGCNCGSVGSLDADAVYPRHFGALGTGFANCSSPRNAGTSKHVEVHVQLGRRDSDHHARHDSKLDGLIEKSPDSWIRKLKVLRQMGQFAIVSVHLQHSAFEC